MIIIPMAGLSSRFFNAGFTKPKYMLDIDGASVFAKSVLSFKKYFDDEQFVFVIRDIFNTADFVEQELKDLGVKNYKIISLSHETKGQAETVYLATKNEHSDCQIIIFNIDTFRNNYEKPDFIHQCDGYLEVFSAPGDHWSFVLPQDNENVLKTTEKDRVSDLCSDGLYYFKRKSDFEKAYLTAVQKSDTVKGEFYIAPLYNNMIANGKNVKFHKIELSEIEFCGTPDEYNQLIAHYKEKST